MFDKIRSFFKNIKSKLNSKGSEFVGFAIILLFVILVAAPHIKTLGKTTSTGIKSLNTELSDTLAK